VAAECGSFSSAARELNTEVSAVSRAVREVEDDLGVGLFERLPRGARLTDTGRSYVSSARDVLNRYERASLDARRAAAGQVLHLALGLVWSPLSTPVALLGPFATDFPAIAVEIIKGANDGLADWLRSGRLDVAIAATDPPY